MISSSWALETTLRLVSFSVLLQGFETIRLRRSWSGDGAWSWRILRNEFRCFGRIPFRVLDTVLSDRGYAVLVMLQLALAGGCLAAPSARWAPALFVVVLLSAVRWRGTFNGGSDYMTVLVLLAVSAGAAFGTARAMEIALVYIGVQVVASYFIAGVVKLKEREWRDGRALQVFLRAAASDGGAGAWVGRAGLSRTFCVCASCLVIAFELAFPSLLLVSGGLSQVSEILGLAFAFHVVNAAIFGLNRFVWAWLAGYPGVLILVQATIGVATRP